MPLPVRPFRFQPCAACCHKCQACKDGVYPDELTVTFAGVQNGQGCQDCTGANGSWVLQRSGDCIETLSPFNMPWQSRQNYHAAFPSVPMCSCGYTPATLDIVLQIGWNYGDVTGQRAIVVTIGNSLGCMNVRFMLLEESQTEPFDCPGLSNVLIPYLDTANYCQSPGATCHVSA